MSGCFEQPLQRYEPLAKPKPNTATKTRFVRPAQYPCVTPAQGVRPQGFFAGIQCKVELPQRQRRAFQLVDRMDGTKRFAQVPFVDALLRPTALRSCLCFGHALLDGLHPVAPGKRPP